MNYTQKPRIYNPGPAKRGFGLLVLVGALAASGCARFRACDDSWLGTDKQKHFLISAGMGAGFTRLAMEHHGDPDAAALGIAGTISIGAGKEWYDLSAKKTCWSWRDFAWDVFGASVGATAALAIE